MSTQLNGKSAPPADVAGGGNDQTASVVSSVPSLALITAALMLLMVLASMEQTVTVTAMPTIIGELHGLEFYAWVSAIYLLAATVVMPLYGRLADVLGRKRVIMAAVILFVLGSILSSFAHSMVQLICFRAVQGLGAGGIMPVVLTILGDIFTIQQRAKMQGFFSAVWGTSALAGPWLGAYLVKTLGWRSIFWVNWPFGLVGLAVLAFVYHDREKPHSTELDLLGIGALATAAAGLLLFLSLLGQAGTAWWVLGGLAILTAASGIFFYYHERQTENPVLPPTLFFQRSIGPALVCSLLLGLCFISVETWVPLYVQGGKGGTAHDAAGTVTPVMLCWALSSMAAAPLVVRWGFRRTATLGTLLIILGFTGLLIVSVTEAPRWLLTFSLALSGLGCGPTSMSYLLGAQDAVLWQQRGIITSSVTLTRTLGGAMGISALGALFNMVIRPDLRVLEAQGYGAAKLLDPKLHAQLPPEVLRYSQQMICGGLRWVFGLMLLAAVLQMVMSRFMPRHQMTQQSPAPAASEAAIAESAVCETEG